MMRFVSRSFSILPLIAAGVGLGVPAIAQNGIFADFATSMGNFSCQLDYTNAPKTVANFIGLVTGQRAWLDEPSGRVRTNAFYNGLTFHRVIPDFMIQGGSPNGLGNDGPGYVILDEIKNGITFDKFGVLAMANSGTNSGGSQFFVTVAGTPWLNGLHTIFGRVSSGSNIVYAISRVARDTKDKPLVPVIMQSVAIRRVGTAALAFDINAQGLPVVSYNRLKIAKQAGSGISLTYSSLHCDSWLYTTTNLGSAWTGEWLGVEIAAPSSTLQRTNDAALRFFRLPQVQYAGSTWAPRVLKGRNLALTLTTGGPGTINITFGAVSGGIYTFGTGNGTVTDYIWSQEVYRGRLVIAFTGLPVLEIRCDFSGPASGVFSGYAYPYYPLEIGAFPVAGTFTLGP